MKIARYLLAWLLIAAALCVNCDLFQTYLYSFDDFCQTSFYVKDKNAVRQMKDRIFGSAGEYGLEVIYIDKDIKGDYYSHISIYCSLAARQMFADEYRMKEGQYGSLFSGYADISFYSVDELDGELMEKDPEGYYLIGQTENAQAYKASLVDAYGGSLPRPKERSSIGEAKRAVLWVWAAVGVLLWLLTYYKTVRIRKEIVVRLSLGESIGKAVLFHAIRDALWYISGFLAAAAVLYKRFHCLFLADHAAVMLLVIIVGEALIYVSLLRCDLKLGFSGVSMSRKLLGVSYVFKTLLTFALAVSAASTFALWMRYADLERQREFYEERKDYSYLYLIGDPHQSVGAGLWEREKDFYREYFTAFDMQFIGADVMYEQDKNAVCANAHMQEYLCAKLPSAADRIRACKACILLPEGEPEPDCDLLMNYAGVAKKDVEVIRYSDRARIVNYDPYRGYVTSYRPVIIFNNCIEDARSDRESDPFDVVFQKVMMKPDIDEVEKFCEKYGYRYRTESVWLVFSQELQNIRKGAFLNMFLLLFQCAVQICLGTAIIRLEFEANRLEIITKKILGYSVAQQLKKPIVMTLMSGAAGMTATAVCYIVLDLPCLYFACAVILGLVLMEMAVVIGAFRRVERDNIQKTLKGGFL